MRLHKSAVLSSLLLRLGPARRLGHDDAVDAQHGDGRLRGELERLLLGGEQVEHAAVARLGRVRARVRVGVRVRVIGLRVEG